MFGKSEIVNVQIRFKSGKSIIFKCESFKVIKNDNNTIESLSWEKLESPKKSLYIKLSEIESIVQI